MDNLGDKALIVEGGAMRGIFSCGVLDQFIAQDFSPFDHFWGVSAGSTNIAAYLAKMHGRNRKIYLDYSLRKEFFKPGQFLLGGDLMDLDWMWQITLKELGLDWATLSKDTRPFFVVVTRQDTGQAEYLRPNADQLAETMKASSALPILYREGVQLYQHRYVDGGVADALPIEEAIRRGARKIMVLRSRPSSYFKPVGKMSPIIRQMLKRYPALIRPMQKRAEQYNRSVALIRRPPQGVEIAHICPPKQFKLKRLSRDLKVLEQGYQYGVEAGTNAIKQWNKLG